MMCEDVRCAGDHAIRDDGGEQQRVAAVEHAAVARHDIAGILGVEPALDMRFGQVADHSLTMPTTTVPDMAAHT